MKTISQSLTALNYSHEFWYNLSSGQTPKEFKSWATKHSNLIKKALKTYGFTEFGKVRKGHFDYSFFAYSQSTGWVYISCGDVRGGYDGERVLIRTAKHEKDYTGGCNNFIALNERFEDALVSFINRNGGDISVREHIDSQEPNREPGKSKGKKPARVQKTLLDFMAA